MSELTNRISRSGAKKLLALDGGGVRGVLSLEILKRLEDILRAAAANPRYVLADYFDYIAGTSTGGIIAAALSMGMSVDDIVSFYQDSATQMFKKAKLFKRYRYRYVSEPLADQLRKVFGDTTTLGSEKLKSLLMLVMRNASTDSPWPVSNNPFAKYNDTRLADCNLAIPLWRLLRASAAAPIYFPPETINLGDQSFQFVDGGITTFNNPAFQMFLMATVDRYWVNAPKRSGWETGTENMLIVSVGTGTSPRGKQEFERSQKNLLFNVATIPSALIFAALNQQDLLCRIFGDCVAGDPLDGEVDSLMNCSGPIREKLFRYVRYNAELSQSGLTALGCGDVVPSRVQRLDEVRVIPDLRRVGKAVADQKVLADHLNLSVFKAV